jgi:hypothetical protein
MDKNVENILFYWYNRSLQNERFADWSPLLAETIVLSKAVNQSFL